MVNQENTAAGSFPELSQAVQAAIEFVNEELGGVDGRPIELEVCNTEFSAEGSTACGQQFVEAKVPAVLGGIDVFGNAIETLADNGIPYIGGIPISFASVKSPNSFQWSGGTWGAAVAFADYAIREVKAEKVAIVYGEFGSITHSAEVAEQVLEEPRRRDPAGAVPDHGHRHQLGAQRRRRSTPDALFILAADSGCKAGFDGVSSLGIDAATFFVGACAAPSITNEAGTAKTDGAIFNVEGPIGARPPNPGLRPLRRGHRRVRRRPRPGGRRHGLVPLVHEPLRHLERDRGRHHPGSHHCGTEGAGRYPELQRPPLHLRRQAVPGPARHVLAPADPRRDEDGKLTQVGDWVDVGAIYAG